MDKAKIFKNGSSQAVRLPKEFRFEGEEVYIKKNRQHRPADPYERFVGCVVFESGSVLGRLYAGARATGIG